MKITVVRLDNNTLKPAWDSDLEAVKRLKRGEQYQAEIHRPRNYKMLQKFNALIKLVFENQETYSNREHLRHDLIIASGYYTMRKNFKGEMVYDAQSISFGAMNQETFEELYDRVLDTIEKYFHFDSELVRKNIDDFK